MDSRDNFLKNLGMGNKAEDKGAEKSNHWDSVIQPKGSYLILGDVGTGKSALAYWLLERYGRKYDLLPTVVGLPRNKQELLPPNFKVLDDPSECAEAESSIVFIDEADLQLPIEDAKQREYVVNFLSLPRQRKQIFILSFHFPRLVLGRYLPFFAAFLLKRPPYLIEFASKSKNDALSQMMRKAEERFAELVPPNWEPTPENPQPLPVIQNTYVVAPRIRWQGMLENPLSSFWTQDLSEVWAGTEIAQTGANQADMFQKGKANTRQSYAHLPQSEILDLCLACARLDSAAYDKIWKPEYQSLMDRLTGAAEGSNLQFAGGLDVRGWIIRRVEAGGKCVMVTEQSCPCPDPLAAGCPVLRGN